MRPECTGAVAGSLITNQVRVYDLLRMFGRAGHFTPLGQAFAEYGRIDKTMHLLAVTDPVDDTHRRLMNRQLTVQESRHRLARAICHGGRGRIRQAYREGQEDQLASLGLVLTGAHDRGRRRGEPRSSYSGGDGDRILAGSLVMCPDTESGRRHPGAPCSTDKRVIGMISEVDIARYLADDQLAEFIQRVYAG